MIEFIVTFIKNGHKWRFLKEKHMKKKQKDKLFLLCLDNCTSLIEKDKN